MSAALRPADLRVGAPPEMCRDFCLWPYQPPAPPVPDARDGAALLLAVAELAGCGAAWARLVTDVRAGLGPWQTVWGLKRDGARLSAELYFYDYARVDRRVSLARALAALAPHAEAAVTVDEALPYFMVSVELPFGPGGARPRIAEADVYIGNPGSSVSSGICYRVDDSWAELKNFYFFFDRAREWEAILGKLFAGMRLPLDPAALDRLLPAWLRDCRTIVVANKRRADALYVSGIAGGALARFLDADGWPAGIGAHLRAEAPRYRHLLFDIGFDFTLVDGRIETGKSSFYGVF